MRTIIVLLLTAFPCLLSAQTEPDSTSGVRYRNVVKTNLYSPLIGVRKINLTYQRYLDTRSALETELFYGVGLSYFLDEDLPTDELSRIYINRNPAGFTGGVNVLHKIFLFKYNVLYTAYGGGYFRYAYLNRHTVCNEVGEPLNGLCPCVDFSVNEYERNVNQASFEIRVGGELPSLVAHHFHLDVFAGIGGRYLFIDEAGKRSHVLCDESLRNENVQEIAPERLNFFTNHTAHGEELLRMYFVIGLKMGYAF